MCNKNNNIKLKYDNHNKILNWAKTYLPKKYNFINEIWLYGSCSKNKEVFNSDVDLMIMLPEEFFTKQIIRQLKTETPGYDLPDVDIHCDIGKLYNNRDNNNNNNDCNNYKYGSYENSFINNVRKDGILIYEKHDELL